MGNVMQGVIANWVTIAAVAGALASIAATIATALTKHPEAESILHVIQGLLSLLQHADVGGIKPPLVPLKKPVVGQPVPPSK